MSKPGGGQCEAGERGPFGLSRNVFVLGLVSFFNDLSSEMVYPLFPTFITEFLGAQAWFLGLVEGLADSVASLLNLFSGWISDHVRRRKALVVSGYSFSGLSRGCLALVAAPWQAAAAWFCNRVGKGVRTAPRDALIADSCGAGERGRAFGYHRSMDHTGALFGAASASILITAFSFGYKTIFAIAFIPIALGVLLLLLGVRERTLPQKEGPPKAERLSLSLKPYDRRFKWLLLAVFIFTLGNSSDAFLLLRARQGGGFSLALLPALWGVLHVVKAAVSIEGGALSDRLGRKKVIMVGWAVYVLAYTGFAFLVGPSWIWLLFVVYGFYYVTEGVQKAFVADLVPPEKRGVAYGIYNFTISITVLPASLLMGLLWDAVGPRYAFLVGAGLAVMAIAVLALAVREG
ncbi:MAG: MFS transporter [Actinobacteria bacterium]|jgi:MFS family permease|nr:MAG: MFS transporter [Actinomycetota bacterium]